MNEPPEVWVVDDDESIRWVLQRALTRDGMRVSEFESGEQVVQALSTRSPAAIVTDIRMPGLDGIALLDAISRRHPRLPVIIMTAYADLDSTVSAYRGGAFEFLPKPFDVDEAVSLVRKATLDRALPPASSALPTDGPAPEILGSSPAMQEVFRAVGRLSRSDMTVLITGESGSGKELVARALHRHGPRSRAPFIALNSAAIPRELLESELFGHERGAFTGAQSQRRGRFEQADGGTLFLDEIGDMPAELQTRLLRVLAEGEFYRVGGHVPLRVDVRVIAATHQALGANVKEGRFREDLYHRLNVIQVRVPALRERREDIPILLRHFLDTVARELGVPTKTLSRESEAYLCTLAWPGNVRQLENTCRWLTVMAAGNEIELEDLPPELRETDPQRSSSPDWSSSLKRWADARLRGGAQELLDEALPAFERAMIRAALDYTGGKRQRAAALLGWGRNTMTRKMQSLEIDE